MQLQDRYLIDSIRRRRETANSETNASTRVHIRTISDQFNEHSLPICTKINELVSLTETRKKAEEMAEDLTQLIASLNTTLESILMTEPLPNSANTTGHYTQLQLTLQRIKTKTYPERVQTLISKLQGHFDAWRTDALKKNNQAILDGTIETLRESVNVALELNKQETARLTQAIIKKVHKTQLRIENLVDWADRLSYFVCLSERQEIDAFEHLASFLGNKGLSPLILSKLDDFFIFLNHHNIKGFLSFIVKAYLELPRKSPKEFKKILDKMKLKDHPPSMTPKSLLFSS